MIYVTLETLKRRGTKIKTLIPKICVTVIDLQNFEQGNRLFWSSKYHRFRNSLKVIQESKEFGQSEFKIVCQHNFFEISFL